MVAGPGPSTPRGPDPVHGVAPPLDGGRAPCDADPVSPALALAAAMFAAGSIATVTFAGLGLAVAPFARVFLEKVTFGFGPRLLTTRVGATVVSIHAFPITSSLTPFGAGVSPSEGEGDASAASLPPSAVPWFEASPWRRLLAFVVLPRILPLGIAAAILGPARAFRAAAEGLGEIVSGALGPLSTAPALLDAAAAVYVREGFAVLAALAVGKWLSSSVLTLPGDVAFAVASKQRNLVGKVRFTLTLILMLVYVPWIVGCVAWLRR